jgi:hypothetical protein
MGLLAETVGDWLAGGESDSDNEAEQTADPLGPIPMFWIPERVSMAKRKSLHNDCIAWVRSEGILEVPSPLLNGRTPRQAGQEEIDANRREAYFFTLNFALEIPYDETETWCGLREVLALPAIRSIDADNLILPLDWNMISFADWTKSPAEMVLPAALLAVELNAKQALAATTDELLRRGCSDEEQTPYEADQLRLLEVLLTQRLDSIGAGEAAVEWIDRLLSAAESLGLSEGQWLVNRWVMMLATEDESGTRETWDRLQPFLRDPAIASRVQAILVKLGVMQPDGTMNAPPEPAMADDGQSAAAQPAGVWTPDSPPPSSGEEKSKLWLPGQD